MRSRLLAQLVAALSVLLVACSPEVEPLPPGEEKVSGEEARIAAAMIDAIREISLQRNPEGLLRRFNQVKSLGCVQGELKVLEQFPAELARGVFATPGASYRATLRYANATTLDDRDSDFRGLSIKLSGVAGEPLWGEPGSQDFLLNSYPGLFAATPEDFLSFIEATRDGQVWRYFINPSHWYSLKTVLRGRTEVDNPFALQFYSTTAYRLGGQDTAVKYSVRECPGSGHSVSVSDGADFLSAAMAARLAQAPVCLEFMVQQQTDPVAMPVENAAVIWDEAQSPFVPVARISVPDQDFRSRARACEMMSFNPWQALAAHRPLGGINRVRVAVYAELAQFRQEQNQRRGEP